MFRIIKDNLFLWFLLFLAVVSPSFFFGAFQLVLAIIAAFVVVILVGMVWLKWKVGQMQKRAGGGTNAQYTYAQQEQSTADSTQRNNGDNPNVKIFVKPPKKRVSENVGDYVDFEELPDDEGK